MRSLLPFRRQGGEKKSRGQSLVEFALILPLFLLFLAGVLDLGRVFYANISLNNAAREGAFAASKTPGSFQKDQPCNTATNMVVCRVLIESKDSMVTIKPTDVDLTCTVAGCPASAGSYVKVNVKGTFSLVTPLLSVVFGGQTLNLNSSATAQIEYLPDPTLTTPPPVPVADFTADNWTGNVPPNFTVNFTDTSVGTITGWNWDFDGDGFADSTAQNPSYAFSTPGTYTVMLTVINGTGSSSVTHVVSIGAAPTPTPTGTSTAPPTPTPTATPSCVHPPNVIGQQPGTATANIINAGFAAVGYGDLTTGKRNRVQAQNPDATQCLALGSTITIHWRPL